MEAAGRHEQQPLQLESSDEEENSSQQVNFVTDPKDDGELFEMAKSKKSSWGAKRKRDLLKAFSVKNPRHIFDKSFSERTDVQELFALFKTKKKKIATWNATLCARKLVYLYRLVQAYDSGIESRRCMATRPSRTGSNKEDEEIGNLRALVKDCEKRLNSDREKDKNKTRRSAIQKTKEGNIQETCPFEEPRRLPQECPKCGHTSLMAIES